MAAELGSEPLGLPPEAEGWMIFQQHYLNLLAGQSCQSKALPATPGEALPRAQALPVQVHFSGFDSDHFHSWAELGDIPLGVQAQQVSR